MRDWYKESKLVDKAQLEDRKIHTVCQYCDRWATHPVDEKANKQEYVWKTVDEMDSGEKIEAKNIHQIEKNDPFGYSGISHGICDICWNILEEGGFHMNPSEIRQKSLAT